MINMKKEYRKEIRQIKAQERAIAVERHLRVRELVTGAICPRAWPGNELSASLHRRVHPAADHFPGSHPNHSGL